MENITEKEISTETAELIEEISEKSYELEALIEKRKAIDGSQEFIEKTGQLEAFCGQFALLCNSVK